MGDSCLFARMARPNLTRSFVEERMPPVLWKIAKQSVIVLGL